MSGRGRPLLMTRIEERLNEQIEERIALAIAKATRGPKDRADFARRAAQQYLRKLQRNDQSRRRRRKDAFIARAGREALGVDAAPQGVYTDERGEDRATLASDPSAPQPDVRLAAEEDSQLP